MCIADPTPGQHQDSIVIRVGHDVHIGAGTVLLSGISIGNCAWIAPGTVVSRNIPSHAIVGGDPAMISGYLNDSMLAGHANAMVEQWPDKQGVHASRVQGVTIHYFARIRDLRGDLSVGEFERSFLFDLNGISFATTYPAPRHAVNTLTNSATSF